LQSCEVGMFTIDRIRWSVTQKCYVRFRLTYSQVFLADRGLWRDFLFASEELGPPEPASPVMATTR
jgi:hypothetical protein